MVYSPGQQPPDPEDDAMNTTTPSRPSMLGRKVAIVGALVALVGLGIMVGQQDREPAAPIVPAPVVTAAPPLVPAPAAPELDPAGRRACDSLAYDIADLGVTTLVRTDAARWTTMVQQYRIGGSETANGLLRDSGDVLERVTGQGRGARELALDTAAARCTGAGWTPGR